MATAESATNAKVSGPAPSSARDNESAASLRAKSAAEHNQAERIFSKSIIISGIRCVLTYLIFPFVLPFLSFLPFAADVGAWLGLIIGPIAIAANVFSIRRFWSADHRWKKPVTALHLAVIALLTVLLVRDVLELIG